jgi:8-oxo-dGTP pyrophosphatase MutT (NUDIX family)
MLQERSAGLVIYRIIDNELFFLIIRYGYGHWGFSKGIIEFGESNLEAAIREAAEETGLTKFRIVDSFETKIEYYYKKGKNTIHKEVVYYLAETKESDVILSFEHSEFEWLSFREAMKKLSFDNDRHVLEKAKSTLSRI